MSAACHLGNHEADELVILPRCAKLEPDQVFGCIVCCRKTGLWCDRHWIPKTGFLGGQTACLLCIDDLARHEVETVEAAFRRLTAGQSVEVKVLEEWLALVTMATRESRQMCFARAVATRAMTHGTPFVDELAELRSSADLHRLLPRAVLL